MVNFLNEYMDSNKKIDSEVAQSKIKDFELTVRKVIDVFGFDDAFKNKNDRIQRFNKSIAEFIFLSFKKFDLKIFTEKKDVIKKLLAEKLNTNETFKKSISLKTSDKETVNFRINYWLKELEDAPEFYCYRKLYSFSKEYCNINKVR